MMVEQRAYGQENLTDLAISLMVLISRSASSTDSPAVGSRVIPVALRSCSNARTAGSRSVMIVLIDNPLTL